MTNGELSADIARLSEQIRQIRIEQGKSPEPRRIEPFVSVPLSLVLIEKLEPFVHIAVKYTSVLAGGTLHRIDPASLDEYREYIELLRCSRGLWCRWSASGYRAMLQHAENIFNASDDDLQLMDLVRRAHFYIEMMRHDTKQDEYDYAGGKARDGLVACRAEVERLKNDPVAYESEYAAALEQYKQLEEDDDIE